MAHQFFSRFFAEEPESYRQQRVSLVVKREGLGTALIVGKMARARRNGVNSLVAEVTRYLTTLAVGQKQALTHLFDLRVKLA